MKPVIKAIAQREILRALRSPGYYILLAFVIFIQGYEFSILFITDGSVAIRSLMRESAFLMLFAAPLITASAIAGERSNKEMSWFFSQPVSETSILLGKSLGGVILLIPLAFSSAITGAAAIYLGNLPLLPIATATFGLFLLAVTCGAAGIFASTFSKKVSTSAALAMGLLMLIIFTGAAGSRSLESTSLAGAASAGAFNPFILADYLFRGIVDSRPIVFFLSSAILFFYLSVLSLRSEKWIFEGREGPLGGTLYSRQTLVAFSMFASALPVLMLFAVLHWGNMTWHTSVDVSGYLTLSPSTARTLATLPDNLRIIKVKRINSFARSRLDDLIDEFVRNGNGKIAVSLWNEQQHFSVLRPLGLVDRPEDGIVLVMGKRVTSIPKEQLYVVSREAETSLIRGIRRLIPENNRFTIFFSQGHKELKTDSTKAILQTMGIECKDCLLSSLQKLPVEDTALAVIAPQTELTEHENKIIQDYLDSGGKLILALDAQQPDAATELLKYLNVSSSYETVKDSVRSFAGGGESSLIVIPRNDHPIGKISGPIQLVYPQTTTVSLIPDREDGLRKVLLQSSNTARMDEPTTKNMQQKAPFSLAVTVMGPRLKTPYTACIFGSGQWMSDGVVMSFKGQEAFIRALAMWIFEQTEDSAIPKEPVAPALVLSKEQSKNLVYVVAAIPAFAVLFAGFCAWLSYRRKLRAP